MNNNKIAFIIANVLVLAALLVICFLFSPEYTNLFWCTLVYVIIAYGIQLWLNISLFDEDGSIKLYFFGLPLTYISGAYVVTESIMGIVFTIFLNYGFRFGFVLQMIVMVAFSVMMIVAYMGKSHLKEKDEIKSYMLLAASQLSEIEAMAKDRATRQKIHSLYEAAKMSNPAISNELYTIENDIDEKINQLKEVVNNNILADDVIADIKKMINQRNGICRGL